MSKSGTHVLLQASGLQADAATFKPNARAIIAAYVVSFPVSEAVRKVEAIARLPLEFSGKPKTQLLVPACRHAHRDRNFAKLLDLDLVF